MASAASADLTDVSINQGFSPLEKETASSYDWSRAETYKEISGSTRVTVAVTDDGCESLCIQHMYLPLAD